MATESWIRPAVPSGTSASLGYVVDQASGPFGYERLVGIYAAARFSAGEGDDRNHGQGGICDLARDDDHQPAACLLGTDDRVEVHAEH